jgi:hypothetical protein
VVTTQGQAGAGAVASPREYTQDRPAGPRKRGAEYERLDVFCGTWTSEGTLGAASPSPGARTTTRAEYDWLPGGFFLQHRGSMRFGEQSLESIATLGFDPATRSYRLHQFDDLGYARIYAGHVNGDVWTFNGVYERVTYTFSRDSTELLIVWEQTSDGRKWDMLCELKAHRDH